MKQKRPLLILSMLLVVCATVFVMAQPAAAVYQAPEDGRCDLRTEVDITTDPNAPPICCPKSAAEKTAKGCLYAKYINPTVAFLSALVGIVVVGSIILGGIQYASSGGDPQGAAKGKGRIVKALYGLVAYMFLYSALQFMSPGGIADPPKGIDNKKSIAQQCSRTFLGIQPWYRYLPNDVFALEDGKPTCSIDNFNLLGDSTRGKPSYILPVALAIVDALIRVAGIVAVAFVIVGGIKFITSNGEPDKSKTARESIINALIGVTMAILAAAVVSFIGTKLSS